MNESLITIAREYFLSAAKSGTEGRPVFYHLFAAHIGLNPRSDWAAIDDILYSLAEDDHLHKRPPLSAIVIGRSGEMPQQLWEFFRLHLRINPVGLRERSMNFWYHHEALPSLW